MPLLDYPRQVSELEKMARLSPPAVVGRETPRLGDASDESTCLVCGVRPARVCTACGSVSYCGEAHQRDDARWHDPVCAALLEIEQDSEFAATEQRAALVDALIDRIGRSAIADLASWDDLLEPGLVGARRRALSELGTRVLTLARALADLDIPARSGVLTIHVIAAAQRERDTPPALWATLARLFPQTRFELALVGPELESLPDPDDASLTLRAHVGIYRTGLWRELGRPDLIVGYHCGVPLYRTWQPTILELRGSGVPLLMTAYRPWEADAEARLLAALGFTPTLEPTANPFASLASRRSTTIANDVARDNAWLTAWR